MRTFSRTRARLNFREVLVVERLLGGQRILPGAVQAALGVDVTEGIEGELMQARILTAGIDRPDVEPSRVLDGAFRIFEDEGVFPWDTRNRRLGHRCRGTENQGGRNSKRT